MKSSLRRVWSSLRLVKSSLRRVWSSLRRVWSSLSPAKSSLRRVWSSLRRVWSSLRLAMPSLRLACPSLRPAKSSLRRVCPSLRPAMSARNSLFWAFMSPLNSVRESSTRSSLPSMRSNLVSRPMNLASMSVTNLLSVQPSSDISAAIPMLVRVVMMTMILPFWVRGCWSHISSAVLHSRIPF